MAQKTSILNSELAVKILSAIASRTDGNYSTNLADELDKSQPSISRILTNLHDIGFIEKGRREKAQYYTVNYEKISEYWLETILEKIEQKGDKQDLEKIEENRDELIELASGFFQNVLEKTKCSGMTVSRLMFDGFAYSIGYSILNNETLIENTEYLDSVIEGLKIYTKEDFSVDIYESMEKSVQNTLK